MNAEDRALLSAILRDYADKISAGSFKEIEWSEDADIIAGPYRQGQTPPRQVVGHVLRVRVRL